MTLRRINEAAPYLSEPQGPRRPRIALMGEFSAGKSTLANLMIGAEPVPMQVVATQLPPVWISHGSAPAFYVDLDGNEIPCDLENLAEVDAENTAYIRLFCQQDFLHLCDIIDMPGISDPNMDAAVWERIMPLADGVIWCSAATQAWRQSEAAVWDGMDPDTQANSILLLTRSDMLTTDRDRAKVLRRVVSETEGLFSRVLAISLLQARANEEDSDAWIESGAQPFVDAFLEIIERLNDGLGCTSEGFDFGSRAGSTDEILEVPSCQAPSRPSQHDGRVLPRRPVMKETRPRPAPPLHPEDPASYMPKFS